jgi:hypothetical protein
VSSLSSCTPELEFYVMRAVKKEASAYKAGPSNINIVGRCFWDQLGTFSDEVNNF